MNETDTELKQAVARELTWDTRVNETEIGVAVTSGVVALTGTVSSFGAKFAAEKAAHRVGGVLDVAMISWSRYRAAPGEPTRRLRARCEIRSSGTCLFPIRAFVPRCRTVGSLSRVTSTTSMSERMQSEQSAI
jgi:hypothetical protein